jgi:CHAT domain-containing protein
LGSEVILERPRCDRLVGLLGGCGSFNVSQSRRNADSCNSPECLVTNIEKVYASEQPGAIAGSLQQAIAEIRRAEQLTGSRTAVVYTYIREQQLELVVLSAAGKLIQKSVFIPGGYQEIRDTVRRFVEEVRDPSSQDYLPFARTLYSWLIAPIEADLRSADTETLVFVMDGPFRTMPISALYDGQRFLVQKYNLATVPNMGSVNFAQRDRRRNTILAMGLTEPMQGFSALPNVGLEVQTITSRVLQGESFLNQQFTINNLKSRYQAQNFGIIHLASLWTVSDAGTVPLMLNFYSKYPTAKSKAIALREAQVAMIEGKVTLENNVIKGIPNLGDIPLAEVRGRVNLKHPYFWSSFTLIGSWL